MAEEILSDLVESNRSRDLDAVSVSSRESRKGLGHIKGLFKWRIARPRYHMRMLKNKGAILVLLWNFLVWSVFNNSRDAAIGFRSVARAHSSLDIIFYVLQALAVGVIMPLAGWLADVRFGRYKVISWSLRIMWLSSVMVTLSSVLAQMIGSYNVVHSKLCLTFFALMGVGFCGFQANIVQFGVDQLLDASTIEITSFIAWYAGSFLSGRFFTSFILSCVQKSALFAPLLISFHLSVVMVTHFLFSHLLVKEPSSSDPFRLVYNVVKYMVKNKYPTQRSAFTYCEDYLPSRIDFGKRKYGGPFTTEQVEDVKTLFRSLLVAVIITAFYGVTYTESDYISQLQKAFRRETLSENGPPIQQCFSEYISFFGAYFTVALVLIPSNEFLIYPLLHRCLPYVKIYAKFVLGAVSRIGMYVTLLALTVYARREYSLNNGDLSRGSLNTTLPCLFQATDDSLVEGSLISTIDSKWFILPQLLHSLSDLLLVIAMIEFFCAQVPYSMKGIVAGITYGLLSVFLAVNKITSTPFTIDAVSWRSGLTLSCEFWYLLMKVLFLVLITVISSIARRYKLRKREDVLPNEQIFAERYYSREQND